MVYIVGSNLESRYGSATNDIAEMRQAGLDYDKTNLLVYTGGSKRWVSDIPSTSNNVLDLSKDPEEKDSKERIVAHTDASANMGIPQTLSEFVSYCTENYPAQHYGLILWNHGGGPLWGYGSDELFKNDSLLLFLPYVMQTLYRPFQLGGFFFKLRNPNLKIIRLNL